MRTRRVALVASIVAVLFVVSALPALANGDDTLGGPSGITVAGGTGIAVGGTGLDSGSGTITFDIPSGATVKQVILYWEGQYTAGNSDDSAVLDAIPVVGDLVGTSYFGKFVGSGFEKVYSDTYRTDITKLKTWGTSNSVVVSGISFDYATDGAGILAIYDDGSTAASIDIRDGNDGAFRDFPETLRNSTVKQQFTFPASTETRTADLALFVSSANNDVSGSGYRPNVVAVTGGVTQTFNNLFADLDGDHWDSAMLHLTIPAGATTLTVEVQSKDGTGSGFLPSSLFWIGAGLMVPPPPSGCTLTQGYWKTHYTGKKYDATWTLVGEPEAAFFDTGDSWIKVFKTAPKKGNAFYILAHQYMAAVLNGYAGASTPPVVTTAITSAASLLSSYSSGKVISKSSPDRATAIALAGLLDSYNKGDIGPGHCPA